MRYRYPMNGYYQNCNCCGRGFSSAPGARAYLQHLSESTYYGIRMSPETTYALGAKARGFITNHDPTKYIDFPRWVAEFYEGWKPCGPDIIPAAYSWFIPQ